MKRWFPADPLFSSDLKRESGGSGDTLKVNVRVMNHKVVYIFKKKKKKKGKKKKRY